MKYSIVVNMPGYLPESEPYTVDSQDEAITALLEELRLSAPTVEDKKQNVSIDEAKKEVVGMSYLGVAVQYNGYIHEAIPA